MTTKQAEKIVKLLEEIDIDVYESDIEGLETVDEVDEFLDNNSYFDVEIIYYSKAMDYLSEHDASLTESMGLAHDMGYTADNINSELLASLLASQNVREDFYKLRDDIEEILQ